MSDTNFKLARDYLDGATRNLAHAQKVYAEEHSRLANSGRIFPVTTVENGHEVTRYYGDIGATFAPFMAPSARARVNRKPGR